MSLLTPVGKTFRRAFRRLFSQAPSSISPDQERSWMERQFAYYSVGQPWAGPLSIVNGNLTGETWEMRQAYREWAFREPAAKAALQTKCFAVAQLDLQVHPDDPSSAEDKRAAEWVKHSIMSAPGGSAALVANILLPGLIDGFSVNEKLYGKCSPRDNRYPNWWTFKGTAQIDTQHVRFRLDPYRQVVGIQATQGVQTATWNLPPEDYLIYTHLKLFENPFGFSDLRAAVRACRLIESAIRLRHILLTNYSGPFLKARAGDPAARSALMGIMEDVKANGWVVVPDGTEIEVMSLTVANLETFNKSIEDYRQEIVQAIQGAYLQLLEGGIQDGRGNTQVHKSISEIFQWWLAVTVGETINAGLVPDLVIPNFGHSVGFPRVELGGIDEASMASALQRFKAGQDLGLELSKAQVRQVGGFEMPTGDDDILPPPAGGPKGPDDQGGGGDGGQGGGGDNPFAGMFSDHSPGNSPSIPLKRPRGHFADVSQFAATGDPFVLYDAQTDTFAEWHPYTNKSTGKSGWISSGGLVRYEDPRSGPTGAAEGQKTQASRAEAAQAVAKAIQAPERVQEEHLPQLLEHMKTLDKPTLQGIVKSLSAKVGGTKAQLADRVVANIRAGQAGQDREGDALRKMPEKPAETPAPGTKSAPGLTGPPAVPKDVSIDRTGAGADVFTHLFGGDLGSGSVKPGVLAAASNATDGAKVKFDADEATTADGRVVPALFAETSGDGYTAQRYFHRDGAGKLVVYNEHFEIEKGKDGKPTNPDLPRGADFLAEQVKSLKSLGADRIETRASGDPKSKQFVGYKVWPKLGYDGPIPARHMSRLPADLKAGMKGSDSILDLYALPGGPEWWAANGTGLNLTFDLKDGSRSQKTLESYLSKRKGGNAGNTGAAAGSPGGAGGGAGGTGARRGSGGTEPGGGRTGGTVRGGRGAAPGPAVAAPNAHVGISGESPGTPAEKSAPEHAADLLAHARANPEVGGVHDLHELRAKFPDLSDEQFKAAFEHLLDTRQVRGYGDKAADNLTPAQARYTPTTGGSSGASGDVVRAMDVFSLPKTPAPNAHVGKIGESPGVPLTSPAPAANLPETPTQGGKAVKTTKAKARGKKAEAAPEPTAPAPKPAPAARTPHAEAVMNAHENATGKAKELLANAIHNAGGDPDAGRAPKGTPAYLAKNLAASWVGGQRSGASPADLKPLEDALTAVGAKPVGTAGQTLPFDGARHDSPEGVSTGHPVTVARQGWTVPDGKGGELLLTPAKVSRNAPAAPATKPDTALTGGPVKQLPPGPTQGLTDPAEVEAAARKSSYPWEVSGADRIRTLRKGPGRVSPEDLANIVTTYGMPHHSPGSVKDTVHSLARNVMAAWTPEKRQAAERNYAALNEHAIKAHSFPPTLAAALGSGPAAPAPTPAPATPAGRPPAAPGYEPHYADPESGNYLDYKPGVGFSTPLRSVEERKAIVAKLAPAIEKTWNGILSGMAQQRGYVDTGLAVSLIRDASPPGTTTNDVQNALYHLAKTDPKISGHLYNETHHLDTPAKRANAAIWVPHVSGKGDAAIALLGNQQGKQAIDLSAYKAAAPAAPPAAPAPKPVASTPTKAADIPTAEVHKAVRDAYEELKLDIEGQDGVIEVPRLYHEMKKSLPGLTVPQFHKELLALQKSRGVELKALNEVQHAKDPHLAPMVNDRMLYYVTMPKRKG